MKIKYGLNYFLNFLTSDSLQGRGEYVKKNRGYCHCCRSKTIFKSNDPWLRDYYRCLKCYSLPRQRHLQYVLDSHFPGWEALQMHESSPSNKFISKYNKFYSYSHFYLDTKPGTTKKGIRCENLEAPTLKDNSIDIFITQDVFEHVFNPDLAAKEIIRVLKPGGIHIFTVPKHPQIRKSYPRATLKGNNIEHLCDEEYHGSPIGDGRSLVTWDYGDDFENLMYRWSDGITETYKKCDDSLGIDGEYLEVFVTKSRAFNIYFHAIAMLR